MTAHEFLNWWFGQLGELIPAPLRRTWQGGRTTVCVTVEGDTVRFSDPSGDADVTCALPIEDHPVRPAELGAFLAALPGPPQRLRIVLAPHQFLVRTLTLPRAARPHLAEAISFQLPKLTPFAVEQVLYACGTSADGPPDGPLSAWLVAVPKSNLARALSLIGQAAPANPLRLERPPEAGEPLELAWGVSEGQSASRRRMRLAWVGMLAAWIGASGLHFHNRYEARAQLDETLSELSIEARKVGALRDRVADTAAQLEWLAKRKRSTPSTVFLLDTLAQILDDHTWLQRFEFDGRSVSLIGISSSPSDLVEALEESSAFEGVRFDAFTRDHRNQADRFNLSARLETPAAEEGG